MKISIVTPSFNQGHYIRQTIESVLNQDYKNFEHIIVDGGSTDDTINILKEYPHLKWISEKDSGPANALNKGFKMANGDIFAWINSDDYYEQNIFNIVNQEFTKEKIDILFGNITFVYPETGRTDLQEVKNVTAESLIHNSADSIRQAGVFFSSNIFQTINGFDENIRIVFDYDLFLRMLKAGKKKDVKINFAYQRLYEQTLTKRNLTKQALEIYRIARSNGAKLTDVIMLKSVVRKILFPGMY